MVEIYKIKKLLKGRSRGEKIEFCNQCLEEPNKYRPERIFALKEYLQELNSNVAKKQDQIERFGVMLGKKSKEFLKEGFEKYENKKIVGFRFYKDSPNMFIVFNNLETQTDFISICCFNNFDDLYISNPYLKLNSEKADKTCATKHVIPPKSKDSGILPKFT